MGFFLGGVCWLVQVIVGVLLLPRLGGSTHFVEEFPHNYHVVTQDILGHPHPVDINVLGEALPSHHRAFVDRPVVGNDEGSSQSFPHFLPRFLCGPFPIFVILLFEFVIQLVR